MSESVQHNSLVEAIAKWIQKNICDKENICLLIDSGLTPSIKRPKPINGHVPDILAESMTSTKWIIIGEAKIARDLDSTRSEVQIKSFLESCSFYEEAIFVLAVPWDTTRYAKSLLKIFKKDMNLERVITIVINEFSF
jgi:hypothetical protein